MKNIIINPDIFEKGKLDWNKYYHVDGSCSNCDHPNGIYSGFATVLIKKGQSVPKKLFICPNCKCKTLKVI